MTDAFLGEIRMFGGQYAPDGWALCQGQSLNIQGNEALYSAIGTAYGGNGTTTFNLPDLRGRVPVHQGQGTSLTNRVMGQTFGTETVAITAAQMPVHTHNLLATTTAATTMAPQGAMLGAIASPNGFYYDMTSAGGGSDEAMNANAITAAGSSAPHNNMMAGVVVNYIICTSGLYPTKP